MDANPSSQLQATCRGCGATFTAAGNLAGKRVKCPECQQALQIPSLPAPPVAPQDAASVAADVPGAGLDDLLDEWETVDQQQAQREAEQARLAASTQIQAPRESRFWKMLNRHALMAPLIRGFCGISLVVVLPVCVYAPGPGFLTSMLLGMGMMIVAVLWAIVNVAQKDGPLGLLKLMAPIYGRIYARERGEWFRVPLELAAAGCLIFMLGMLVSVLVAIATTPE